MPTSLLRFVAFAIVVVISIISLPTTPSIAQIQTLHHFTGGDDGRNPAFRLVPYEADLIGVTRYSSDATIFRIGRDGSDIETLKRFTRREDTWPIGVTVSGSQLFGAVDMSGPPDSGSAVFRFSPSDETYDRIHAFEEELLNFSGLLSASGSTLFGTITHRASDPTTATLFKLNSDGTGYQPLREFVLPGSSRLSGPIVSGDHVYGVTTFGDLDAPATLYRIRTDGSGFQTLHTFNDAALEGYFAGDFSVAGSTIYGAVAGGVQSELGFAPGSVYKVAVDGSGFDVLRTFPELGGASSLVLDGTTLYGVTSTSPPSQITSVFQMNIDGTGYEVLHVFNPQPELFPGTVTLTVVDGQLYGTTSHGGQHGMGTIFTIPTDIDPVLDQWNVDGDGNWLTATNWSGSVPDSPGSSAVLGAVITSPRTVMVDFPVTVGRITLDSTHAYTLAGRGPIILEGMREEARIDIVTGNHVIETPITLSGNTMINVMPATSSLSIGGALNASGVNVTKTGAGIVTVNSLRALGLSINSGTLAIANSPAGAAETAVVAALAIAGDATPTAKLDLANNAAIINYTGTSPVATVRQQLVAGRGGPGLGSTWNGPGITSSTAQTANAVEPESRSVGYAENSTLPLGPYTTFRGESVDNTSVLMVYTRTGDANLDGVVNDDDVTIVGASYAPGVPQPSWALGDFDYNGFVDDDDVTLLGAFYDASAPPLGIAPSADAAEIAAVPEPTSALLFITALLGLRIVPLFRRQCRTLRSDKL